eukprot:6075210-Prymnesium_polylepis.1
MAGPHRMASIADAKFETAQGMRLSTAGRVDPLNVHYENRFTKVYRNSLCRTTFQPRHVYTSLTAVLHTSMQALSAMSSLHGFA